MFNLSKRQLFFLTTPFLLLAGLSVRPTDAEPQQGGGPIASPSILRPGSIAPQDREALEKSALGGSSEAAKRLAENCTFYNDYDGAYYWYIIGAENGDSDAMYNVWAIQKIVISKKMSKERGIFWLRRAASLGNARAINELSRIKSDAAH